MLYSTQHITCVQTKLVWMMIRTLMNQQQSSIAVHMVFVMVILYLGETDSAFTLDDDGHHRFYHCGNDFYDITITPDVNYSRGTRTVVL